MVAALDAEPRLAAVGCRIVTHDRRTGRPVILGLSRRTCCPVPANASTPSPLSAPVTRSGAQPGNRPAAMTRNCSSAGRNSISACARSPWAGASAIAATSSSATRSRRPAGSLDRRPLVLFRAQPPLHRAQAGPKLAGARAARAGLSAEGTAQRPAAADRCAPFWPLLPWHPAPSSRPLPADALSYLFHNDRRHRGSLLQPPEARGAGPDQGVIRRQHNRGHTRSSQYQARAGH